MELTAQTRTELGKKSKKIRKIGKIPAVMFGKGFESVPLTLEASKFEKLYKVAGESSLVDLKIDDKESQKVLISEVEFHPVTDKIIHANFHKVNLKEKINATVPLEIVGESPIVKAGEGLLLELMHEVTVEALPTDLPHDIKVDVSALTEIGHNIQIKDLPIDHSKVEIVGQDPEELVVKIDYAEMKEEVAPVVEVVPSEAELVAKVEATEQLTEEEKALRDKAKKEEKEKSDKE